MKNKYWEAVHTVYTRMEELCGKSLCSPDPAAKSEGQQGPPPGAEDDAASVGTETVVHIRSELRTQLDFLKATLAEQYSERDSYLVLFAVVAQIDEVIQTRFLRTMQTSWPLLQKELFQLDNAGEVFYEILDDILLKPQTSLFIKEVYYFCLRYGFRGRYQDNPVKLSEYLKKLEAQLEQVEIEETAEEVEEEASAFKNLGSSPYWSYLITVALVAGGYLLFIILGKYL